MNLLLRGGGHEPTLIASGRADPDADDHDCKQTWATWIGRRERTRRRSLKMRERGGKKPGSMALINPPDYVAIKRGVVMYRRRWIVLGSWRECILTG